MAKIISSPENAEVEFYRKIIGEYLKYGSVDKVFQVNQYNLPISFAAYHRLLDRWGVVKAAGPNTKLSEALAFLSRLIHEEIPLEALYRKMPPSFQISMQTLHRILSYVKRGLTRRVATGLVITQEARPEFILVGNDVSTPRLDIGKPFGSISLPMGYSKKGETADASILRVLQQEVFTDRVIRRNFPYEVIPYFPQAFAYVDVADVRVVVYHIKLSEKLANLSNFSSYKLADHRYLPVDQILSGDSKNMNLRSGVVEAVSCYSQQSEVPQHTKSLLNQELLSLALSE